MIWFFIFIFGLCIGSFLNCVVYRLNHSLSPLWGRSICPNCKHKLAWRDNIPLLSFALLRGKCRYCHSPISWQYPIVELATGLLTVFILQLSNYELRITSYNLLITYSLIAIFVSDLLYLTIPDKIVFSTMGLAIFFHLRDSFFTSEEFLRLRSGPPSEVSLGGVLLAALGAAFFFYFLVLITRGQGMGMGDVKLAGLMGLILGWPKIIVALYLAFLTGAITGVILILLRKKRFGEHIPFGPFLAGSTWVSLFWGQQIFENYSKWFLK